MKWCLLGTLKELVLNCEMITHAPYVKYEILLVLTSYCLALTSLTVDWLIIMYKVSNCISWYLADQWVHISLALHAWNKIGTGWESCVYKKIWLTMWFNFFAVEIIYPYIVSNSVSPLIPKLWSIILLSSCYKLPADIQVWVSSLPVCG